MVMTTSAITFSLGGGFYRGEIGWFPQTLHEWVKKT